MSDATQEDARRPGGRVSIDRTHAAVYKAQVAVAKAVRKAVTEAGLDRRLAELINVRVSQINRCSYCLDVHVEAALAAGETGQRLAVLAAWDETTLFSERERAALVLAEAITELPDVAAQDVAHAQAMQVLDDAEISAISWVAIAINTFNRISITSRHQVRPRD